MVSMFVFVSSLRQDISFNLKLNREVVEPRCPPVSAERYVQSARVCALPAVLLGCVQWYLLAE
jgi:hypothetical protein